MRYEIWGGTISVSGKVLFDRADFAIRGSERTAIVGENGCGKSTFLRVVAGLSSLDRDDRMECGQIVASKAFTIGYLGQTVFPDEDMTLAAWMEQGMPAMEPYGKERFFYEAEFDRLLTGFGLKKTDKEKTLGAFSGGEQVKLALIHLLLQKPELLILDEPTNHLDTKTIAWLEQYLKSYEHAILFVSHDRYFLDEAATVIYDVEQKKLVRYVGNYTAFRAEKAKRQEALLKAYDRYLEEEAELKSLLQKFKGKKGKEAMLLAKQRQLAARKPQGVSNLRVKNAFLRRMEPEWPGGKQVFVLKDVCFGYDRPLTEPVSLRIRRGQKLAVIGENGVGKSTLLSVLAKRIQPISGSVTEGFQVKIGYFSQKDSVFTSNERVIDWFKASFPMMTEQEVRSLLAVFLFPKEMVQTSVSSLSGGEAVRLRLAKLFYECPNCLILDEPTNHLDLETKEAVEEMLRAYKGTLIFVSHDRYFVDRVADSLLILQDGAAYFYPFGYRHFCRREETMGGALHDHLARMNEAARMSEALADSFRNVPEKEQGERITEEELYEDWRLRICEEDLHRAKEALCNVQEKIWETELCIFTEPTAEERLKILYEKEGELSEALTALCVTWFSYYKE